MNTKQYYDILVRVYTPKLEEVHERVERALEHARQIIAVSKEFPAIQRVLFLVPMDYDCGETRQALRRRLADEHLIGDAEVVEFAGHHSCEVLNCGLAWLTLGTRHAIIVSGKAMPYFTVSALHAIDRAFTDGAKVAGLAIGELRDIVLNGRIQNTFAAWDVKALVEVGGFDCKTGVEEIAPLIRLAREFGRCIVPIDIESGELDVLMSSTARERHAHVMGTKIAYQQAECERLGSNFEFIRNAVM